MALRARRRTADVVDFAAPGRAVTWAVVQDVATCRGDGVVGPPRHAADAILSYKHLTRTRTLP